MESESTQNVSSSDNNFRANEPEYIRKTKEEFYGKHISLCSWNDFRATESKYVRQFHRYFSNREEAKPVEVRVHPTTIDAIQGAAYVLFADSLFAPKGAYLFPYGRVSYNDDLNILHNAIATKTQVEVTFLQDGDLHFIHVLRSCNTPPSSSVDPMSAQSKLTTFDCLPNFSVGSLTNNSKELVALVNSISLAASLHRNQRRKDESATPYINHPISVMRILVNVGITNTKVLEAAVLHDTIEDCGITAQYLLDNGVDARVVSIVTEVTDDKSLSKTLRKKLQVANARGKSPEAALVKLADKLDNMRSLLNSAPIGWSVKRIQGTFLHSKMVTDQICDANSVLELCLSAMYSARFAYSDGKEYPAIPADCKIEEYYAEMDVTTV